MSKQLTPQQEKIKEAFQLAQANCGGKLKLQVAINTTASWIYTCINRGTVPLKMAMKLEVLTRGEVKAVEMAVAEIEEINAVSKYLK